MITMDEYKVVDSLLPNFLEQGDLIKVKDEVYEILNIVDTPDGWDLVVINNYHDIVTISVPDGRHVLLVMEEEFKF